MNDIPITLEEEISKYISVDKTIDKPEDLYNPLDNITFTIKINNNSNNIIRGLFFREVIDEFVAPIEEDKYLVNTTSGIITNSKNPVTISGIDLDKNSSVIITITGMIKNNF